MWNENDIARWVARLRHLRGADYRTARAVLLEIRNEIGEATVTEAQKQKRQRYLAKRAARKATQEVVGEA